MLDTSIVLKFAGVTYNVRTSLVSKEWYEYYRRHPYVGVTPMVQSRNSYLRQAHPKSLCKRSRQETFINKVNKNIYSMDCPVGSLTPTLRMTIEILTSVLSTKIWKECWCVGSTVVILHKVLKSLVHSNLFWTITASCYMWQLTPAISTWTIFKIL